MEQVPDQHSSSDHGPYGPGDLLSEIQICALLGGRHTPIHRSSLWRGVKLGFYPRPLKIGPGGFINRWLAGEIFDVIEAARVARDNEKGRPFEAAE